MGCKNTCCNGGDKNTEMVDGNLPEQDLNNENKNFEEETKLKSNKKYFENNYNYNNLKQETVSSECFNDQKRNEDIFDFFNDLRNNPQNYKLEAEKYNLNDIISSAIERRSTESLNNLIKNPFFNLFLDTYIRKTPYSKENILENIENNEQLKIYKKNLYTSESSADNINECVWNLLKDNKDKALDEILYKKIDYFIVSTFYVPDRKVIMAYFLFLKKNNLSKINI